MAAGISVLGLGLSVLYATTGWGVPCPFRLLTGWQCPFCGGTRMGSALLHGDLSAAFAANPFVLLGVLATAVLGLVGAVGAVAGSTTRPLGWIHAAVRRVGARPWLVLGLGAMLLFGVLRNVG